MRPTRLTPTRLKIAMSTAGLLALAACGSQQQPPAPPPPEVTVMTIRPQQIANVVELPGRIAPVRTAEVRARVDGIVERRLYTEGSDVRAGQPLFAIDPRELRASLGAVQATLQRNIATAANAAQDVARYKPLLPSQAISKQENDAAVAKLRTAQADVAQARAQVESARLSLGYTRVVAPISGRVGRAQVTEGALVSASGGTLLTTIEQLNPIYVNFSQSSGDLVEIRREITGGKLKVPSLGRVAVTLVLEDGTTYGATGHLDFLDLSIDENTGTSALRAEFPNTGQVLLPGQFVRARIEAGVRTDGLLVPQRAIKITADGGSVMIVGANNLAVQRKVTLGDLQGGNWVIKSGLKAGDRLIVEGMAKAQPGRPVKVVAAPAAHSASAPKR